MSRHDTCVQCDPRPGNALHIGHGSAAIDIGTVPTLLFEYVENANRCRMTLGPGGYRRARNQRAILIQRHPLVGDRDDDLQRIGWRRLGSSFFGQFRFCVPMVVLVPVPPILAWPEPALRPKRKLGVCERWGK